ncbi:MAG: FAD binding domain-containing protein [Acidimicrobiia bacterium]|nr:FAD binding domain-containing protein [Acidimicrobiia bacterium]
MQTISTYHRPGTLEEALALLTRDGQKTVVIGGGTGVSASELPPGTEVVDLQAAAESAIDAQDGRVVYGSMARLQELVDHPASPPLLVETALREGPNTLRNAATVGGTTARAHPDSELVAALLVHDAVINVALGGGARELPLADLLRDRSPLDQGIITSVSIERSGETASARTGRTPADASIVAAVGRVVTDGIRLALTGVAAHPILAAPGDLDQLDPPGDFRGSSAYRKALAGVLAKRVVDRLGGAS